ncbi:hypothetical protein B0T17DRAFT_511611 [Bombardia bombarda]|uniref:Uncharacterized protein n=1 Tax=Bombardia bombarda TaxID=252184 RepID=A0AA39WBJ6_9PEZI|nr:hypothetical protein B0T17DRAFT_511611 [Bombardia bombarda]
MSTRPGGLNGPGSMLGARNQPPQFIAGTVHISDVQTANNTVNRNLATPPIVNGGLGPGETTSSRMYRSTKIYSETQLELMAIIQALGTVGVTAKEYRATVKKPALPITIRIFSHDMAALAHIRCGITPPTGDFWHDHLVTPLRGLVNLSRAIAKELNAKIELHWRPPLYLTKAESAVVLEARNKETATTAEYLSGQTKVSGKIEQMWDDVGVMAEEHCAREEERRKKLDAGREGNKAGHPDGA